MAWRRGVLVVDLGLGWVGLVGFFNVFFAANFEAGFLLTLGRRLNNTSGEGSPVLSVLWILRTARTPFDILSN